MADTVGYRWGDQSNYMHYFYFYSTVRQCPVALSILLTLRSHGCRRRSQEWLVRNKEEQSGKKGAESEKSPDLSGGWAHLIGKLCKQVFNSTLLYISSHLWILNNELSGILEQDRFLLVLEMVA